MARRGGPPAQGIPYSRISRVPVTFSPTAEAFLASRAAGLVTVLSGANNSGKTLFLRQLRAELGHEAYLLQCNRFSHIDVLNTRHVDAEEFRRYYDSFLSNYYTAERNHENNEISLEQMLTSLSEPHFDQLLDIASDLIGQRFTLKRITEARFSPYYVDMDGQNLRFASTGTRLLFSLLGLLFDERFHVVLIDEPEISLSPRVQHALARLLYDREKRATLFPHLQHVFIVTHSHVFLDRTVMSNNYVANRAGLNVTISPVSSPSALHHLQLNLLGNDLEALSLPSAIIVVEGESDQVFLSRVFEIHLPQRRISVVRAGGDGAILQKVNVMKETLGEIATGPYHDRLFAILDARNSTNKVRLISQGVREDHIYTWRRNGIEYLYPNSLLANVFRCTPDEVSAINRETDPILFNGVTRSKKALATEIANALAPSDPLGEELMGLVQAVAASVS